MSYQVKREGELLTLDIVKQTLGQIIYVPTNNIEIKNLVMGRIDVVNAWFVGLVAGYQENVCVYDIENEQMMDTPLVHYNILLSNGYLFTLADVQSEINVLTLEEYNQLIEIIERGGKPDEIQKIH